MRCTHALIGSRGDMLWATPLVFFVAIVWYLGAVTDFETALVIGGGGRKSPGEINSSTNTILQNCRVAFSLKASAFSFSCYSLSRKKERMTTMPRYRINNHYTSYKQ